MQMMKTRKHTANVQRGSTTTLKLDTERRAWLVREATAKKTTLSDLMREAIDILRVKNEAEKFILERIGANRAAYPTIDDRMRFITDAVRAGKMPYENGEDDADTDPRPIYTPAWVNDIVHRLLRDWRERGIYGDSLSAEAFVDYIRRRSDFAAFTPADVAVPEPEPSFQFEDHPIKNNTDGRFGGQTDGVDAPESPNNEGSAEGSTSVDRER